MRIWCSVVAWVLGIKSYLLGTEPRPNEEQERAAAAPEAGLNDGKIEIEMSLLGLFLLIVHYN